MTDDLKALRDEMAGAVSHDKSAYDYERGRGCVDRPEVEAWAARLTSIIERNEKERAVIVAVWGQMARSWNGESVPGDGSMPSWIHMLNEWLKSNPPLTERAKPL